MENKAAPNVHAPAYILKAKDWLISLALVFGSLAASILFTIGLVLSIPRNLLLVGSLAASGLGAFLVYGLYFFATDRSRSFIDIPDFSLKAIGIGLGVGGILTILQAGLTIFFTSRGMGSAFGPLGQLIQSNGVGFLVGVTVINVLISAPAEEFLYRNAIQKTLYRSHRVSVAVVGAAVIFTIPHLSNSLLGGSGTLLTTFVEVFLNGLGYGMIYAYWKRLDITIIAHGVYNCAVFLFAYFHVFGS